MKSSSLGFVRPEPKSQTRKTVPVCEAHSTQKERRSSYLSHFSVLGVFSFAGVGTTVSAFSIVAIFSLFSVMSIASVFGISSVASVLSIASSTSVMSIASTDCVFKFYEKCLPFKVHEIEREFEIHLAPHVWDEMATCTKLQYKSSDRPESCDYQEATCIYRNLNSEVNVTDSCKVRRKGSSTWRDLDDKPSFKIKKFGDGVRFGEFPCGTFCPPGKSLNVWESKKVTLQNQVIADGEIDAYNVFRKYIPSPLAEQTRVRLYRNDSLFSEETYVMLETIDDDQFLEKWFGTTAILYELDDDSNPYIAKFERYIDDSSSISDMFVNTSGLLDDSEKKVKEATEEALKNESHLANIISLGFNAFDKRNLLYYYAAEKAVNHWDAVCSEYVSNTYVVFNGSMYFYVPSGTDETFQCPTKRKVLGWSSSTPQCQGMRECYMDDECKSQYEEILEHVESKLERDPYDACPNIDETIALSIAIPFALALILGVLLAINFESSGAVVAMHVRRRRPF